jgi:hypothetical protein
VPPARVAIAALLLFLALPVAAYGLLYIGAIWTSDTSTFSLAVIGGFLLAIAAALTAVAVLLLRGGRLANRTAKPS